MVSVLREISSLCQRYNEEFRNTRIFFRNYGDIESDQLLQRVNQFIESTNDRAKRLTESIEPSFNILANAWKNDPQQWREMVQDTAIRLSIEPRVIEQNFLNYIGLIGQNSQNVTYDYLGSLQETTFDEKKKLLIESNEWTAIDQTLQPSHSFSDVRNLLQNDERELNILEYYFESSKGQNNSVISLIDLLFNPKFTIKYSVSTLIYVTLRDINLLGLNVFLNDTARNSLHLIEAIANNRTKLTSTIERLNNEQSLLNNTSMQMKKRKMEKNQEVEKLKEEVAKVQYSIDLLTNGIRKMNDLNAIVSQFQQFEMSFLRNMITGIEETYGASKTTNGHKFCPTRQPTETDLQNISDYEKYLDVNTLIRVNSDFEDYRINIARLLNLLKVPCKT